MEVGSVTSTTVTLQWKPPETPNGVITQYSIQYDRIVINDFGNNISNMMNGTVEGLSPDTKYALQLRAHTRVDQGPPSSLTIKTCKLLNTILVHILTFKILVASCCMLKLLLFIMNYDSGSY